MATAAEEKTEQATAEHYREYLNLHGQQAGIKTRMEVLKEILVHDLQAGGKNQPGDLPFICKLQKRTSAVADWKGRLLAHLTYCLHSEKKAEARMEQIASGFEMKTVEALTVERNKGFTV